MIEQRTIPRLCISDNEIRTMEQSKVNHEKAKKTKHRKHLNLELRTHFFQALVLFCLFSTSSFIAITRATASDQTEKNGG